MEYILADPHKFVRQRESLDPDPDPNGFMLLLNGS